MAGICKSIFSFHKTLPVANIFFSFSKGIGNVYSKEIANKLKIFPNDE